MDICVWPCMNSTCGCEVGVRIIHGNINFPTDSCCKRGCGLYTGADYTQGKRVIGYLTLIFVNCILNHQINTWKI